MTLPRRSVRRGQAEMIGLLLIVIILVIGFLLYVRFSLTKDDGPSAKERFDKTQLGTTFVTSLAKTDIPCGALTAPLQELIVDIASGDTSCPAENAVDSAVTAILHDTLDMMGKNYLLRFVRRTRDDQTEPIGLPDYTNSAYEGRECTPRSDAVAADIYPVPALELAFPVEIRLYLCS